MSVLPVGRYRSTVVGVTYCNDNFLLLHKEHWKWWDFPQGGVEEGETLTDAMIRELDEEVPGLNHSFPVYTGIHGKVPLTQEAIEQYPYKGNVGKHLFYFCVPIIGSLDNILVGDEGFDALAISPRDTVLSNLHEQILPYMRTVLNYLRPPEHARH